jgi:uncharacterized repeat protein (TIGR01451 family)
MRGRLAAAAIAIALAVGTVIVSAPAASGQVTTPVTVTIPRFEEIDNPDPAPGQGFGDHRARVRIDGFAAEDSAEVDGNPPFGVGIIGPWVIEPFWTFSRDVDLSLGTIPITIEIIDGDTFLAAPDDLMDVNPLDNVTALTLLLDLNTGNWTGDVPLNQPFAQGDGDTEHSGLFEGGERGKVFFDVSLLSSSGDADGDGLLDGWETRGLDANGDGSVDVDLPAIGADPNHKDLFLELDWMAGNAPTRAAIQAMKTAFANAPINAGTSASAFPGGANAQSNPDGLPGINLWVDTGSLADPTASEDGAGDSSCGDGIDNGSDGAADGADADCLVGDDFGGGNQLPATGIPDLDDSFYAAKAANFDRAARRLVFRYGLSAAPGFEDGSTAGNSCFDGVDNGGGDEDSDGTIDFDGNDPDCWPWGGGWGEVGGNDFIEYNHDGGTIMHEFGHTLNLRHGGFENANCKPPYVSVMNYDHQFGINQNGGTSILDYSPPRFAGDRGVAPLPTVVENNLTESTILDPTDPANQFAFTNANGRKVRTPLQGMDIDGDGTIDGTDWNGDGAVTAGVLPPINVDTADNNGTPGNTADDAPQACINGSSNGTLAGSDDWTQISLQFRQFGDAADGAINKVSDPEITLPELLDLQEALNTTDVAVDVADSPDPVAAGTELTYTITVTNNGPNPASDVRVVDTLPADASYVSDDAGCTETVVGTVRCDLGEILAGGSRVITITTLVPADLVYDNGGPKTITNHVTVDNLAGPDPTPANDEATEDTLVVAIADLEIVSFEPADGPIEILIGEPVDVTFDKVIANNGPSSPMDVHLSGTATAEAGTSVIPATFDSVEPAVAMGDPRTVEEVFTLACSEPGLHAFEFTNGIEPANAADTDPDLSNNAATVSLTVDCVVPIAINIRPHGFPNSINLRSTATVAALTTEVGEYGLPLAFDATSIQPLTVLFGTEAGLFNTAEEGAPEVHGRGHLEDSYELDERTRDGDTDMVLHFEVSVSGLAVGDTEACVKGRFTSGSDTFTFFGCDSVIIRP